MTVRRWCGVLLGLAALAIVVAQLPAQAGEDKLEWKAFDKKTNPNGFYQTLTTKTNQKMKVAGQELAQDQEQTFFVHWIPEDKDAKGNWIVKQKIVGVRMKIDIGGNKIEYDSVADQQPQNPLTDFFKKLMSLELKFTVTPKMKVEKIEGREEFINELGKVSPQMKPLLEKILSEEALKSMADQTWAAFPPEGSLKQKEWKNTSKLDLGPIGIYETNFTYTSEGTKDKMDKIGVKSTLKYEKPAAAAGLPFQIKAGELTGKDGKGEVVFNREKGRIDSSKMDMTLAGKLTISIAGMDTEVEINQTQNATSVSSDTNPVDELKKKEPKK